MRDDNGQEPGASPYEAPREETHHHDGTKKASALDAIMPTNPIAAISCYMGIGSILLCGTGLLLGPIAVGLGIWSMKKWTGSESDYGQKTSRLRAWIGIVTGAIGFVVGVLTVVAIVV